MRTSNGCIRCTFQDKTPPASKEETADMFEILTSVNQSTRRDIPEENFLPIIIFNLFCIIRQRNYWVICFSAMP